MIDSKHVVIDNKYWDKKAKRNKIMDLVDSYIDRSATDPVRALADIDEAGKQLQALRVWAHEAYIQTLPKPRNFT